MVRHRVYPALSFGDYGVYLNHTCELLCPLVLSSCGQAPGEAGGASLRVSTWTRSELDQISDSAVNTFIRDRDWRSLSPGPPASKWLHCF